MRLERWLALLIPVAVFACGSDDKESSDTATPSSGLGQGGSTSSWDGGAPASGGYQSGNATGGAPGSEGGNESTGDGGTPSGGGGTPSGGGGTPSGGGGTPSGGGGTAGSPGAGGSAMGGSPAADAGASYDGSSYGGESAEGGSEGESYAGSAGEGNGGEGNGGEGTAGSGGEEQEQPDAGPPTCDMLDPTTPEILYLSADDSNSMASPVIARRLIQQQAGLVPGYFLRTFEFLNYYNVPYEPAEPGSVRIVPQMSAGGEPTDVELQIGVQSALAESPRRPLTMTLILDRSGSMAGNPIELSKAAVKAIAASMKMGDIVSAVTWNTTQNVLLSGHVVEGPNDPALIDLADSLMADGSTDLHAGLVKGYELADQHFGNDRINRVVLISDGQANVGVVDEQLIGEKSDDENKEGIYLVGVGVGDGLNDTLMNTVTDAGNGAYVYLDSADEAQKIFGSRFDEVMDVAARAVQVKATLPWYFSMYKYHGEEYSHDPKKVKPQHLAPGDAMVFHQILRACEASKISPEDPLEFQATWKDPFNYQEKTVTAQTTIGELMEGEHAALMRGRAIVAYAETLKIVPTLDSEGRRNTIAKAREVVMEANPDSAIAELNEIDSLLEQYGSMWGM